MYIFYAFILSIIKYWINEDFQSASFGSILQHLIESLNLPEAYCDWDTDNNLDIDGHYEKWKSVLLEMRLMVLMQLITNPGLLVPLWVTGSYLAIYFCWFCSNICNSTEILNIICFYHNSIQCECSSFVSQGCNWSFS